MSRPMFPHYQVTYISGTKRGKYITSKSYVYVSFAAFWVVCLGLSNSIRTEKQHKFITKQFNYTSV